MTPSPISYRRSSSQWTAARTGCALALAIGLAGCVTPWEKSALLNDKRAEIGSVQGPQERRLRGLLWERRLANAGEDDSLLKPIAGTAEFEAAEALFDDEQYREAEKAFKNVARKFKKSEIREDALFMQAESAFAQERFSKAHDLYAQLLKDYPTTRHLDKISTRMFKIAMVWLDHPQVAEIDQIQQVNHERYGERLPPKDDTRVSQRNFLFPNLTDERRPLFDTQGNAIAALRSIWINDPTGPLADDALMLAASYYARSGNFVEADRHFTMLREQFPNSPHVAKAFELGSHVKLMSYQGSQYDAKSLYDSEQLKLATLRLYPDHDGRERMEDELKRIELAKADRLWSMAVFYEQKGNKKASAIYCHMLLHEFPDLPHAKRAEKQLAKLGPGYADGRALQSSFPDPPKTLMTAIFPPDDHGGIPVPPTTSPFEPQEPQVKYGAKFALIKPVKPNPQADSPATDPAPRAGARFALIKPPKEQRPEREADASNTKQASGTAASPRSRWGILRRDPPRRLPDDAGSDARPAVDEPDDSTESDWSAEPSRSTEPNEPLDGDSREWAEESDDEGEDDDGAGHTEL